MVHAAPSGPRVLVYGAAGHTGRFVVAELLRRGLVPVLSGRDERALADLGARHPDLDRRLAVVDDPGSLERAAADVVAVVNCAGPFVDTAVPLAAAAIRAGAHYLDVSAEQGTTAALRHDVDAAARDAGVVILPSTAFYGGLADLLATSALGGRDHADEITVATALDRWWPTEGTRRTGDRAPATRLVVTGGRLAALDDPAPTRAWTFPAPFGPQEVVPLPFAEVVVMASHLSATRIGSYLSRAPLDDLHDPATGPPVATDDRGRSAQRFLMQVVVRAGGDERSITAAGRDIYAVTAPIVVEATTRLLERAAGSPAVRGGVTAPGAVFDPDVLLEALSGDLEITRGDSTARR